MSKGCSLDLLKNIRANGIKAITLPDDDSLINVLETAGHGEIMLATRFGLSIRFKEDEIRPMGRPAYGVRGIRFKRASDEVVSSVAVDESCTIFTVTEKGYGKCAPCSDYRLQARGGSGIINVRSGAKNGRVVSLNRLSEEEGVILVTDTGRTIRFRSTNIPVQKRGGLGVKLMGLNEGEVISGVAIVEEGEIDGIDTLEEQRMRISVLGAGAWGTAFAIHCSRIGNEIMLWAYEQELVPEMDRTRENTAFLPGFTMPETVQFTNSIDDALDFAETVIIATPSFALRGTLTPFGPKLSKKKVLILTKGIERSTFKLMNEVVEEITGSNGREHRHAFRPLFCARGRRGPFHCSGCRFKEYRFFPFSPAGDTQRLFQGLSYR